MFICNVPEISSANLKLRVPGITTSLWWSGCCYSLRKRHLNRSSMCEIITITVREFCPTKYHHQRRHRRHLHCHWQLFSFLPFFSRCQKFPFLNEMSHSILYNIKLIGRIGEKIWWAWLRRIEQKIPAIRKWLYWSREYYQSLTSHMGLNEIPIGMAFRWFEGHF